MLLSFVDVVKGHLRSRLQYCFTLSDNVHIGLSMVSIEARKIIVKMTILNKSI